MIEIELFDGTVLEFPEGTPRDVVNRVAKEQTLARRGQAPSTTSEEVSAPAPEIDRSGVKDYGLRANLARADNASEYKLRLKDAGFTEDMYFQDPMSGEFVLRLDNVPQQLKEQYGLKNSGNLQIEDDEVFTKQDIAEFFSANSGPILGGIAASVATGGAGLLVAAAAAGAGSAGGYLLEEGMEYANGVQDQDLASVGRTAAYEAVAGAVGEGVGRGIAAVGGRLIKGPGGDVANEARALGREALGQGARPTVKAATTRPILGRLQAIYEGVFPNQAAAKANGNAVINKIKELKAQQGIVDDVDYNAIQSALQRDIDRIYGTPEQLLKDANKNLDTIVQKEIDKVKDFFGKPDPRGGESIAEALQIAKQTFDEDVGALYGKADILLGRTPIIDTGGIKNTLSNIIRDNPALGLDKNAFGKFVMDMDDAVSVQTASSLRTMLNQASFDPSLVGAVDRAMLSRLNKSVQNAFNSSEAALASVIAGNTPPPGAGSALSQVANLSTAREGLKTLRDAQNFYAKGVDRFQDVMASKLFRQYREAVDFNPEAIIDPKFGLLTPNNAAGLRRFLNAATPMGRTAERSAAIGRVSSIPQRIEDVVPDTMVNLGDDVGSQNLKEVIRFLPDDDPLKRYYAEIFENQRIFAESVEEARRTGVAQREAVRRQLAGSYLNKMFEQNKDLLGRIDPAKVADEIRKLGSTAKVLFKDGPNGQYNVVMDSLKDMATLGKNVSDDELARLAGRPITEQIEIIRALTGQQEKLKGTRLLQTLERAAQDNDPETILNAVFRRQNAAPVKAAKDILGESSDTMEAVRDLALRKILVTAGDPDMSSADDFIEAVFNGTHASKLESALNAYGRSTLDEMFGKETTDGLYALTKFSQTVSQAPIKGLGGLAPASIAAGLGVAGALTAPFATLTTVGGLLAMSRLLRSKPFLKLITRPVGVRPGKSVPYDELGRVIEQAYEIAGQLGAAGYSQGQREDAVMSPIEPIAPRTPEVRAPAPVTAPRAPQVQSMPTRPVAPARSPAQSRVTPDLLGADPVTQQRNLELMQRLGQ